MYAANRVRFIRGHSDPMQWNCIESKKNPADDTSRGVLPSNAAKVKCCANGSAFLWKEESTRRSQDEVIQHIISDDPEVKKTVVVNAVSIMKEKIVTGLQLRVSDRNKMVRIMAWVMKFVKFLLKKRQGACSAQKNPTLTAEDLQEAEMNVLRNYHQSEFQDACKILSSKIGNNQKFGSNIACLNPFLDSDGTIRVGGRLKKSSLEWSVVHPILLPRKGSITKLIVKWCHEKAAHRGRNITLNEVRSSGYWVLQGN